MSKKSKTLAEGVEQKGRTPLLRVNGSVIAYAHMICAYLAFVSALIVGCFLHYKDIVQNASYGYPDEWFPSVSATIGDMYPERSLFQVMIALTAGPRFLLLFFNFVILYQKKSILPYLAVISGVIRTFTCGGWVYITSTDDHDWHDIFMISYMVLTIPWTVCISLLSPPGSLERKGRAWTAFSFFATLVPLIYWFIQHKVHVRAGAYSVYAYFEWALILLDVAFDGWSIVDFKAVDIEVYGEGISFNKVFTGKAPSQTKVSSTDNLSFFEFLVHLVNAFTFWSVATSLLLCVWYFPLWHMGISGYEAVVVVFFVSPLILILPWLRRALKSYPFITRSLTVIFGLGAYKVQDPENRLLVITVGTFFGIVSLVNELWSLSQDAKRLNSFTTSILVGLLATSVIKFACFSNNPVWPIMHKENGGFNEVGIFVSLLAAFFTPTLHTATKNPIPKRQGGSILFAALGFAGYFFCIQSYLSDSSTLIMWAWNGYPVLGPTPVTGAVLNFASIMFGIITSIKVDMKILSGSFFTTLGALSAFTLYTYEGWVGYAGSCIFSAYLASISPVIWHATVGYNPALLFSLSFLFEIVIALASVWIVAYAFVPGGWLLRERTDVVLSLAFFMISAGILNYNLRCKKTGLAQVMTGVQDLLKHVAYVLTVLLALSIATTFKRYPSTPFTPYNESSGTFTAGIWCVHFGLDNDMWSSETRMLDLIRDAEVDIIGLLESDTQRLIGGNRDFTQKIAEDLGMYVDYGPGPNKHTWGAALLSKFPILRSSHHLLPSPVGELAPAIHATLDIYGQEIDVVVFHSGQEEDEEDRRLQSLGIEEIMANSSRPLVLLSYLVTEPLQGNYNTYVSEKSRMHDIDSTDWDRWCEYILFRDLKKVAYARISRSTITDTELQIAKFKPLSSEELQNVNFDFLYGNNFVSEQEIDKSLRMPQLFRGDGVRGHAYHVFDEPRYFAQDFEASVEDT